MNSFDVFVIKGFTVALWKAYNNFENLDLKKGIKCYRYVLQGGLMNFLLFMSFIFYLSIIDFYALK